MLPKFKRKGTLYLKNNRLSSDLLYETAYQIKGISTVQKDFPIENTFDSTVLLAAGKHAYVMKYSPPFQYEVTDRICSVDTCQKLAQKSMMERGGVFCPVFRFAKLGDFRSWHVPGDKVKCSCQFYKPRRKSQGKERTGKAIWRSLNYVLSINHIIIISSGQWSESGT